MMDKLAKKAQVGYFLILGAGLLLVLLTLLIFFVSQTSTNDYGFENVNLDAPIKSCMTISLDNALKTAGYQAGYVMDFPPEFVENVISGVPYWVYNGVYTATGRDFIANQIEDYLDIVVPLCVKGTYAIPLSIDSALSDVRIYDDSVVVEMDVVATITQGDKTTKTGKFIIENDLPLGDILSQAENIVFEIVDLQGIPITYINQQKFPVFINEKEDGIVLEIVDYDHTVKGDAYSFVFAVSFEEPDNYAPALFYEGPFTANVGDHIYIDYDATDDSYEELLTFSFTPFETYNDMVIDEKTGVIEYVPLVPGKYTGYVKVTDAEWLTDVKFLDIEVEE
ncbi:hypothetical protein H6503_03715 [Candidatus Woesearchaeota archaeon]|nr:hypothetical protein [Candidatus Woesearchaeota archaeon]